MKLFIFLSLMLLGFAQFSVAQEQVQLLKLNAMSNVFAITTEGGVTLGLSDYKTNKMNYTGKLSLEYYMPSTGSGNFGFRAFAQTGLMSGLVPPAGSTNPTNELSTQLDVYGAGAFYILSIGDVVYPWLGVGGSNLWFHPKDGNGIRLPNPSNSYNSFMLAANGDLGVKIFVSKSISVNLAGGMVMSGNDYLDGIKTGAHSDVLYTATAGLSFNFGRETDSDGDGVANSVDMSPNTPAGVKVDEFGVPLDSDRDGIADYLDKCSDTPAGAKVDAAGCPLDSDADGVPDYLDKCTGTPAGAKVDASGCTLDSDGDGVPDYLDKCTGTPAGAQVDAVGCPLDSDGDGVANYLDKCPNTPIGTQVNAEGCPIKKETVIVKVPSEIRSLVLSGDANFESNKSKLLPNAYAVLDSLVSTMKGNAGYKWEVGGYTDAVGSDKANKKLSQRRAKSVVDYLVSKGVSKNSLTVVGYGEQSPITTNDTVEGRSMNRRVEIKLLSNK